MLDILGGNLLSAVATVINWGLEIYMWIIIARAVVSWVNPDPYNPIVRFLFSATEPVLYPIRRRLPMAGIDFSPLVVIAAIIFLKRFVVQTLFDLAHRM